MAEERVKVLLHLTDLKALGGLKVDNGCMPFRKREDGSVEMVAAVSRDTLAKLKRKRSVFVQVLDDSGEQARRASEDVSRTNRYSDGSLPKALGLRGTDRVD